MTKILTLDDIKNMPIDDIITLYRNGYTLDESHTIATLQDCPPGCTPAAYGPLGFFSGIVVGLVIALAVMPKKSG